mmetsp:Transcript_4907/g.17790  ORF Transcript_4907/g.17790 Transcript_4907/m.17790 type:complete len:200 (+) Transcript_4907:3772-4371(+)
MSLTRSRKVLDRTPLSSPTCTFSPACRTLCFSRTLITSKKSLWTLLFVSPSWSSSRAHSCSSGTRASLDDNLDRRRSCSRTRISVDSASTALKEGTCPYALSTGRAVLQYLTASAPASSSTALLSLVGSSKMKESFLRRRRMPLSLWILTRLSARFELILKEDSVISDTLDASLSISPSIPSTFSFMARIVSVALMNLL